MAVDITVDDLTSGDIVNGEWQGTGILDKLIETMNKNIEVQYQNKRINGTDYANVYLGMMQTVLTSSIDLLVREKMAESEILANKARVRDEYGLLMTDSGELEGLPTDKSTKHYWELQQAENKVSESESAAEAAEAQARVAEAEVFKRMSDLSLGYGLVTEIVEVDGKPVLQISTTPEVTSLPRLDGYTIKDVDGKPEFAGDGTEAVKSLQEAAFHKAAIETSVGVNTAKGYKADSYYKMYRSLQELMFALTNTRIIDDDTDSGIYAQIIDGMEKSMNAQGKVWGDSVGIDLDGDGQAAGS